MYCTNCGAKLEDGMNFCAYCGQKLTQTTTSISLMDKAVSTANDDNQYNLILVSCGSCDKTTTGDLLEDVFGYTDAESSKLISMAPVVVGERLTASEAQTVAQFMSEYGVQVSIINQENQYIDLTSKATSSVFDSNGNLLAGAAAIIGALTVANRIRSYRRFKKPSLLERLFSLRYKPQPPAYHRRFRPHIAPAPLEPRRMIRKAPPMRPAPAPAHRPAGSRGILGGGSQRHGGGSTHGGGPSHRGGSAPRGRR